MFWYSMEKNMKISVSKNTNNTINWSNKTLFIKNVQYEVKSVFEFPIS